MLLHCISPLNLGKYGVCVFYIEPVFLPVDIRGGGGRGSCSDTAVDKSRHEMIDRVPRYRFHQLLQACSCISLSFVVLIRQCSRYPPFLSTYAFRISINSSLSEVLASFVFCYHFFSFYFSFQIFRFFGFIVSLLLFSRSCLFVLLCSCTCRAGLTLKE